MGIWKDKGKTAALKSNLFMRKLRSWIIPLLLLFVVLYPDTRVWILRGLMKVGLFSPSVKAPDATADDFSAVAFSNEKGEVITLGSLKGKVVVINFWATWCPPCRAEMPSLQAMYAKWKDHPGFVFLAVDADNQLAKANKFLQKNEYTFPAYQQASPVPASLAGNTLPETVVLDKNGKLVFRHVGMANYDSGDFHGLIGKLLE
jgi:thiol-disulfide isomerase/thioredoxin